MGSGSGSGFTGSEKLNIYFGKLKLERKERSFFKTEIPTFPFDSLSIVQWKW